MFGTILGALIALCGVGMFSVYLLIHYPIIGSILLAVTLAVQIKIFFDARDQAVSAVAQSRNHLGEYRDVIILPDDEFIALDSFGSTGSIILYPEFLDPNFLSHDVAMCFDHEYAHLRFKHSRISWAIDLFNSLQGVFYIYWHLRLWLAYAETARGRALLHIGVFFLSASVSAYVSLRCIGLGLIQLLLVQLSKAIFEIAADTYAVKQAPSHHVEYVQFLREYKLEILGETWVDKVFRTFPFVEHPPVFVRIFFIRMVGYWCR